MSGHCHTFSPDDHRQGKALVLPLDATRCQSFGPGHKAHLVQGSRAFQGDQERHDTQARALEEPGWIGIEIDGELVPYWTHYVQWVEVLREAGSVACTFYPLWYFMTFDHENLPAAGRPGPRAPVSVYREQTPCVFSAPPNDPVEALNSHGGFTLTGDALRALIEKAKNRD